MPQGIPTNNLTWEKHCMGFLSFLVLLGATYLLWRITDQLPDLVFRLSEIQRDVAEIRRKLPEDVKESDDD
ncbi:MAG: hypothetical protein QF515_01900 [Pseudomonadales bacterium]|nr:hypothetical protein [Pseudomonadales bacterium]